MGWLKLGYQRPTRTNYEQFFRRGETVAASQVAHVEDLDYPLCSKDTQNEDLPFIPAETVSSKDGRGDSKLCLFATKSFEVLIDVVLTSQRDRYRQHCL